MKIRNRLFEGDCLRILPHFPAGSIDLILCDLPYGTTHLTWDSVIPMGKLWAEYNRVIKPNGVIVLFGREPFTSLLITSNLGMFKYSLVWVKSKAANYPHAKNMPLLLHEDITVFSKGTISHNGKDRMHYTPQGVRKIDKRWKRPNYHDKTEYQYHRPSHSLDRVQEFEGYPGSALYFNSVHNPPHPTQKPVDLCRHLISTYTPADADDLVILDNAAGSGTTGVACIELGLDYVLIEKEARYCVRILERLKATKRLSEDKARRELW